MLVDLPATGVEAWGVGALAPFLEFSFWPPRRKLEDTARAPAAAVLEEGAMAS